LFLAKRARHAFRARRRDRDRTTRRPAQKKSGSRTDASRRFAISPVTGSRARAAARRRTLARRRSAC